jgi:hypothetical protein
LVLVVFKVMIGYPKPAILHEEPSCLGRDMHAHESSDAVWIGGIFAHQCWTLAELKIRARKAPDSGMDIPHARWFISREKVVLDKSRASAWSSC